MPARAVNALATLALLSVVGLVASRALLPRVEKQVELLPFDASMFSVSAATGGDFYFWEPGEFANANLRVPLGGDDVLLAYPVLDGGRHFPFPVDTLTSRLEVFVSAQELAHVRLVRPDGRTLDDSLERVDIQSLRHIFIATVRDPNAGSWRLEVDGQGQVSLSVRAGTDRRDLPPGTSLAPIQLIDFELTELRGRPGHQGFFELEAEPAAGSEHPARVVMSGSFATAELGVVGTDGEALSGFRAFPLDFPEGDEASFNFVVPDVPYRVVVFGRDLTGMPYQRFQGALRTPAP